MYEYGFRCEVNILLRSYLSDRVEYISISGETTSCQKSETGVPQGSIRGLLLVLLYINDITKCNINCNIALFEDDTSIWETNRKNDTGFRQDVNELFNWYTANNLSVNLDKCEILPFCSGQPVEIKMMNNTIPYKKSCKYLGIHLDSSLRLTHHIGNVSQKRQSKETCSNVSLPVAETVWSNYLIDQSEYSILVKIQSSCAVLRLSGHTPFVRAH